MDGSKERLFSLKSTEAFGLEVRRWLLDQTLPPNPDPLKLLGEGLPSPTPPCGPGSISKMFPNGSVDIAKAGEVRKGGGRALGPPPFLPGAFRLRVNVSTLCSYFC